MVAISTQARDERKSMADAWWAYRPRRGWVVLDRSKFQNRITHRPDRYEFVRCADWSAYRQGTEKWAYQQADRYLAMLPSGEAMRAAEELARLQREYAERAEG